MSPFEESLMQFADAFLSGDREAFGEVYRRTHGLLAARAVDRGADPDIAEDIASDAILYVRGRGIEGWNGKSIMALLNTATDWFTHKSRRTERGILQSDLPLVTEYDDIGEEWEHPLDLETLEEQRLKEGAEPHPFLTSITLTTPEDIELAENLREMLERFGREGTSDEAWEVYADVTLYGKTQREVAEERGLSQQRVSQICGSVVDAIRERMGMVG